MAGERRRTAVVGGGVAGLTAAHVLREAHDVTLYEADDRVGGHAHTHELGGSDGRVHRVDSGFMVHNRRTYPHLLRLFDELGVATQESEMEMSVRCEGCGLEYAGAHGPAGLLAQPVTGGSQAYVERVVKQLTAVRTATPVRAVTRHADGVDLTTEDGTTTPYGAVVIATHPDQALRLLADPTDAERSTLGAFRYSRDPTLLHTDTTLPPRSRGARVSWNYLMPSYAADADPVTVSYDMNRLQRLDAPETFVVTPNGSDRVDPGSVRARMVYEHPVCTPESVAAQARLPALSGPVTAYAGAYHGWGFHEDGCRSGVEAVAALGVVW